MSKITTRIAVDEIIESEQIISEDRLGMIQDFVSMPDWLKHLNYFKGFCPVQLFNPAYSLPSNYMRVVMLRNGTLAVYEENRSLDTDCPFDDIPF